MLFPQFTYWGVGWSVQSMGSLEAPSLGHTSQMGALASLLLALLALTCGIALVISLLL
jgi:hypothetical protein